MLYEAKDYDEFKDISSKHNGFIKVNFCGQIDCENKIKEETGLKSRCIIDEETPDGKCVRCGKDAEYKIYFGRQY